MANKRKLIDSAELISMLPIVEKDRQISLIGAVADVVAMTSKCRRIDAVEVVRCRDCKHMSPSVKEPKNAVWCQELRTYMGMDDFCSYGKPKEKEKRVIIFMVGERHDPNAPARVVRDKSRPKSYFCRCSRCRKHFYLCGANCDYEYCPRCRARFSGQAPQREDV